MQATLDIEFIMGLAQNVTTYFWSNPGLHDGQACIFTTQANYINIWLLLSLRSVHCVGRTIVSQAVERVQIS